MLKAFFRVGALTLLYGVLVHAQTTQAVSLQDQYLQIYVKMKDAEDLEKKGDLKTAFAEYSDCQKRLLQMRKTDPQGSADLFILKPSLYDTINDRLAEVGKKLHQASLPTSAPSSRS